MFLIAGIVFVLVQGGVLFLAWRYRKRKDDDDSLPPQLHGNFKLEIGWTILPALLLAGVGAASVLTLLDLEEEPPDAMQVTVVGPAVVVGVPATTSTATARTTSSPPTTW